MSFAHTARIELIKSELAASKVALNKLLSPSGPRRVPATGVNYEDIGLALANVEDTYFLRLTAECESCLREHLINHFPGVRITDRDGFLSLVNKATRNLDPTNPQARIPAHLADATRDLRPHRNAQAHGHLRSAYRPSFDRAASILSQFLFRLP